jgi:hypothetical protein
MKLKLYLSEETADWESANKFEEVVAIIRRDCRPFLSEFKKPLWRAYRHFEGSMLLKRTRLKGREPRGMSYELQEFLDNEFENEFGWKARSGGVFVSDFAAVGALIGDPAHLFFPIGKYKYVWSPDVNDANISKQFKNAASSAALEEDDVDWKAILKTYTNKGYNRQQKFKCECSFRCKTFYLVNMGYNSKMNNFLPQILEELGMSE